MCVLAYLFTPAFKLFYSICHSDSKLIWFLNTLGVQNDTHKPCFI